MNITRRVTLVWLGVMIVAVLCGCDESPKYWQPKQITCDLTKSGRNDIIQWVGVGNDGGGHPTHYEITVMLNTGNPEKLFKDPIVVLKVSHNLEPLTDVKCVDLNGDGIPDLLYRVDQGYDMGGHPAQYNIMVAYGRGDGTFSGPILIRSEKPVGR